LTNAEVFDFAVGDVFHRKYYNSNGNSSSVTVYYYDTITQKSFNTTMDSIFYEMHRTKKTIQSGSSPPLTVVENIVVNLSYSNLSSAVSHYSYYSFVCPWPNIDSIITILDTSTFCGVITDMKYPYYNGQCLEPNLWNSTLYKGLGGPYYFQIEPSGFGTSMPTKSFSLVYYNTSQNGTCGTQHSTLGNEEVSQLEFKLFPNPVNSILTIDVAQKILNFRIFSALGAEVHLNEQSEISSAFNVSELQNGLYILQVESEYGIGRKTFIKL
jgi:hypothetical protein